MQSQPADLKEKTSRYERMLEGALEGVEMAVRKQSYLDDVAGDYLNMARSYYRDGVHFVGKDDLVNALVCFSYGHAWLDAGIRLGVFTARDEVFFAI